MDVHSCLICQYQHSASFNQQQKGGWVEFLLKRTSGGGGGAAGLNMMEGIGSSAEEIIPRWHYSITAVLVS